MPSSPRHAQRGAADSAVAQEVGAVGQPQHRGAGGLAAAIGDAELLRRGGIAARIVAHCTADSLPGVPEVQHVEAAQNVAVKLVNVPAGVLPRSRFGARTALCSAAAISAPVVTGFTRVIVCGPSPLTSIHQPAPVRG